MERIFPSATDSWQHRKLLETDLNSRANALLEMQAVSEKLSKENKRHVVSDQAQPIDRKDKTPHSLRL